VKSPGWIKSVLLGLLAIGLARCVSLHGSLIDRIDTVTFKRGIDAYNNPDFYRQLGKAPEQLMTARLGGNLAFSPTARISCSVWL
jgi:hypothetical protein